MAVSRDGYESVPGDAARAINVPPVGSFGSGYSSGAEDRPSRPLLTPDSPQATFHTLPAQIDSDEDDQDTRDVVQFSTQIWYVRQEEEILTVSVMRIGSLKGSCTVTYTTQDASAKAGDNYELTKGEICMVEGQETTEFHIRVFQSTTFNTTLEFHVVLDSSTNCALGHYLKQCRVKIIGRGLFPSDKFPELATPGKASVEKVGGWRLYFATMKLIFQTRGLGWRTVCTNILMQAPNFYLYARLYISVYFVDVLFDKDEEPYITSGPRDGRVYTAYLIGCVIFFPQLFMWMCCVLLSLLNLEDRVNHFLKLNLFNKYLNYSDDSRIRIGTSRMQDTVYQECNKVAASYMTSMHFFQVFGKAVILCIFISHVNAQALKISATMPIIMLCIASIRIKYLREAGGAVNKSDLSFLVFVQDTFKNYATILEYAQRPKAYDQCQGRLDTMSTAKSRLGVTVDHNNGFGNCIGPLYVAFHIFLNVEKVLDGKLGVGSFVTTIEVYGQFSLLWSEVYKMVMAISGSHGAIKNITECFNMETDLMGRLEGCRASVDNMIKQRKSLRSNRSDDHEVQEQPVSDMINIELVNMGFGFASKALFKNVNLSVKQGQVVAICGEHSGGKATLMRILAGLQPPDSGKVIIPSHLRTLFVPQQPVLLPITALENLIFGNTGVSAVRLMQIISKMGLDEPLVQLVRHDLKKDATKWGELPAKEREAYEQPTEHFIQNWHNIINYSQVAKMHTARAFIMNPEILIMQRPLDNFSQKERVHFVSMLETHVTERGIAMPAAAYSKRRPRTLIFSPSFQDDLRIADLTWLVNHETKEVTAKIPSRLSLEDLKFYGLESRFKS